MGISYGEKDKREKENLLEIWDELFSLGICKWVRNIAGTNLVSKSNWKFQFERFRSARVPSPSITDDGSHHSTLTDYDDYSTPSRSGSPASANSDWDINTCGGGDPLNGLF